jgi:hypothetical protein
MFCLEFSMLSICPQNEILRAFYLQLKTILFIAVLREKSRKQYAFFTASDAEKAEVTRTHGAAENLLQKIIKNRCKSCVNPYLKIFPLKSVIINEKNPCLYVSR